MLERLWAECVDNNRWDFHLFKRRRSQKWYISQRFSYFQKKKKPKLKYFTETWILPFAVLAAVVGYAVLAIAFYNKDGWFQSVCVFDKLSLMINTNNTTIQDTMFWHIWNLTLLFSVIIVRCWCCIIFNYILVTELWKNQLSKPSKNCNPL